LQVEAIAGQAADTQFANRARSSEFGRDELIEQPIGHPDRCLPFSSLQIREAGTLLLSEQLEHDVSIHLGIVPLCFTEYQIRRILALAVSLRKVILLVEDDEELRRMFRTSLLLEGYDVLEAGDGLEALMRIDRQPPDLIVLDLMLPSLSGVAVRQEIAGHALTRDIPIVIVTGSAMNVDYLEVECVLRKPVAPEELVTAVKRCFHRGSPGLHL
jgi:CheY-like chemotaxis protein